MPCLPEEIILVGNQTLKTEAGSDRVDSFRFFVSFCWQEEIGWWHLRQLLHFALPVFKFILTPPTCTRKAPRKTAKEIYVVVKIDFSDAPLGLVSLRCGAKELLSCA